jgi:hypothetical protein
MRLTKREIPVFRFEFNFADSGNCLVVHDIPVEILRQDELAWSEPLIPESDSRVIMLYPLKRIKSYLERLKSMNATDMRVVFDNHPQFANVILACSCDSVKTNLKINKQPVFSPEVLTEADEGSHVTSEVQIPVRGLIFIIDRILTLAETCKCLILASENKYLSAWIQLPHQYGSVAVITPAFAPD